MLLKCRKYRKLFLLRRILRNDMASTAASMGDKKKTKAQRRAMIEVIAANPGMNTGRVLFVCALNNVELLT